MGTLLSSFSLFGNSFSSSMAAENTQEYFFNIVKNREPIKNENVKKQLQNVIDRMKEFENDNSQLIVITGTSDVGKTKTLYEMKRYFEENNDKSTYVIFNDYGNRYAKAGYKNPSMLFKRADAFLMVLQQLQKMIEIEKENERMFTRVIVDRWIFDSIIYEETKMAMHIKEKNPFEYTHERSNFSPKECLEELFDAAGVNERFFFTTLIPNNMKVIVITKYFETYREGKALEGLEPQNQEKYCQIQNEIFEKIFCGKHEDLIAIKSNSYDETRIAILKGCDIIPSDVKKIETNTPDANEPLPLCIFSKSVENQNPIFLSGLGGTGKTTKAKEIFPNYAPTDYSGAVHLALSLDSDEMIKDVKKQDSILSLIIYFLSAQDNLNRSTGKEIVLDRHPDEFLLFCLLKEQQTKLMSYLGNTIDDESKDFAYLLAEHFLLEPFGVSLSLGGGQLVYLPQKMEKNDDEECNSDIQNAVHKMYSTFYKQKVLPTSTKATIHEKNIWD